jgi:hypothetical protein
MLTDSMTDEIQLGIDTPGPPERGFALAVRSIGNSMALVSRFHVLRFRHKRHEWLTKTEFC